MRAAVVHILVVLGLVIAAVLSAPLPVRAQGEALDAGPEADAGPDGDAGTASSVDATAPDAGADDAGAPGVAEPAPAAGADAAGAVAEPPEPETPKQKRKRLRRERWQELAGLLGDEIAPKKGKDKNKDEGKDEPDGGLPAEERGAGDAGEPASDAPADDGKKDASKKKPWRLKKPDLGGFIQVFFRQPFHTGADPLVDFNNFRVLRVRLSVDGELFPWLGYAVSVDPRAPEITGILRDAYLELKAFKHGLRIGQQKTTFGYENSESSSELYFVNRAEMADAISRGFSLRDIGVGLIGHIKLGDSFRIEDAVTVVNGAGFNVQADNTATKSIFGRLGGRFRQPAWGDLDIALGVSGSYGDYIDCSRVPEPGAPCTEGYADAELVSFKRVGADVEVDQEWFFFAAEYGAAWDVIDGEAVQHDGYYAQLVGKTPWSVGPTIRYDAASIDGGFQRATFGAYWGMPNDLLRVMVNYEMRLLKDGSRGDDKLFVWTQVEF